MKILIDMNLSPDWVAVFERYTQVIELPHPNPPLSKGRELDFLVSPLSKGGLRGVKPGSQSNSDLCVHRSLAGRD
ncbi:hypothetical protein NIES4075_06640 [Tolypothrix sp. NIES-4075]|nr:hypothetical protein NIES4075_06640 [Tolypothrix sp. NIES-4075]